MLLLRTLLTVVMSMHSGQHRLDWAVSQHHNERNSGNHLTCGCLGYIHQVERRACWPSLSDTGEAHGGTTLVSSACAVERDPDLDVAATAQHYLEPKTLGANGFDAGEARHETKKVADSLG